MVLAAYYCNSCSIEGSDPEVTPGWVNCWNCGERAHVTARIVVEQAA